VALDEGRDVERHGAAREERRPGARRAHAVASGTLVASILVTWLPPRAPGTRGCG
jgi:hypothetical protein